METPSRQARRSSALSLLLQQVPRLRGAGHAPGGLRLVITTCGWETCRVDLGRSLLSARAFNANSTGPAWHARMNYDEVV
eukprot:5984322-Amphidinium_carterae.2